MKKLLTYGLLVFLLCQSHQVFAQKTSEIDALEKIISSEAGDSLKVEAFYQLGKHFFKSDYERSKSYFEKSLAVAKNINFIRKIAKIEYELGRLMVSKNNYTESIKYYKSSVDNYTYLNDKLGIALSSLRIAQILIEQNEYEEAVQYLRSALKIEQELQSKNYNNRIADIFNEFGDIHAKQDHRDSAFFYYTKAHKIYEETKDTSGLRQTYTAFGNLNKNNGDYEKALENFLSVDKLVGNQKNKNSANNLHNIGTIYYRIGDYNMAWEYSSKALEMRKELDDQRGLGFSFNSLGLISESKNDYETALQYYLKSLKIKESLNDKIGMAGCYGNMGNLYVRKKDYKSALSNLFKALDMGQKINNSNLVAECYNSISVIYLQLNELQTAKLYSDSALRISKEIGAKIITKQAYDNLVSIDSALGNHQQALISYRSFIEYRDSLWGLEKSKQITELQTKYETEKKDKEIVLLNKENDLKAEQVKTQHASLLASKLETEKKQSEVELLNKTSEIQQLKISETELNMKQQQTEARLRDNEKQVKIKLLNEENENKERTKNLFAVIALLLLLVIAGGGFFIYQRNQLAKQKTEKNMKDLQMQALRAQMNPHFVFNCMNSIQRYILKNDKTNAVDYLQKFATLIRLILDNSEQKTVSLKDELEMLELYMQIESLRLEHGFDYEINAKAELKEQAEIPSMILQPYIENAIWHGLANKDNRGKIKIDVLRFDHTLQCVIADNGIGRKKAAEIKDKSVRKHQSKGLSITQQRLEIASSRKLRASSKKAHSLVEVTDLMEDNIVSGTIVTLNLPL